MRRPIGLNHLLEITFFAPNLIQLGETPYGKRVIANIDGVLDTDVPNIVQGDTLSIFGTTYTVVEIRPDGEGMTDLRLRV